MSDTPRTDADEQWAEWNGNEFKCVHASFARELERELIAVTKALREIAEGYEWSGSNCREHAAQALKSLLK